MGHGRQLNFELAECKSNDLVPLQPPMRHLKDREPLPVTYLNHIVGICFKWRLDMLLQYPGIAPPHQAKPNWFSKSAWKECEAVTDEGQISDVKFARMKSLVKAVEYHPETLVKWIVTNFTHIYTGGSKCACWPSVDHMIHLHDRNAWETIKKLLAGPIQSSSGVEYPESTEVYPPLEVD
jgi:hypothetical protein